MDGTGPDRRSALIWTLIGIAGFSAILGAVLALHIATTWKVVIIGFSVLLCLLLAELRVLDKRLVQVLHLIRRACLSAGYQRLNPEDRASANNIPGGDVAGEQPNERLEHEPGGGSSPSVILWTVYVMSVAFVTFVIYQTLR